MGLGQLVHQGNPPDRHSGSQSTPSVEEKARAYRSAVPRPFLRWAGSKRAHLVHVVDILPKRFGTYWEPFLGSGSLFFLLEPNHAVLGDACKPLVDSFRAVRDGPKAVLGHLDKLDVNKTTYYAVRQQRTSSRFHLAANFIYLNKTCWNGLYRVNSRGQFNVPYGRPKSNFVVDPQNLHACSRSLRKPNVRIQHGDFERILNGVRYGDLVFLDPPYVTRHNNNGFIDYNECLFSWRDQERLCRVARRLVDEGAFVIVANADHTDVINMYEGFSHVRFSRASTLASDTSKRGTVREAILYAGSAVHDGD